MRARVPAAILALVALTGASLLGSCTFGAFDALTPSGPQRPTPADCGACHAAIYAEWRVSRHATAVASIAFRNASAEGTLGNCLPCHAPSSVFDEPELLARDLVREHGVDCVACHLADGAMVGPLPSTGIVQPHPIRTEHPLYLRSELCGRCHEETYAQWTAAPAREPDGRTKRTCQQCHMPVVERTVTQASDALSSVIVAAESVHIERRHRFDLGALDGFPDAVDVVATQADGDLRIDVRNRLPHSLPTGQFGPRTIVADVRFEDAVGVEIERRRLVWSMRLGTSIAAYGRDSRNVPIPTGAARATVTLRRPERGDLRGLVLAGVREDLR